MNESQGPSTGIELELDPVGDADPDELERLAQALRRELLELDVVESVSPASVGAAPPGARAVDVLAIGTLLVGVGRTTPGLRKVIATVRSWLAAQPGRTVRVQIGGDSIELTNASPADHERLVDSWIRRHTEP